MFWFDFDRCRRLRPRRLATERLAEVLGHQGIAFRIQEAGLQGCFHQDYRVVVEALYYYESQLHIVHGYIR